MMTEAIGEVLEGWRASNNGTKTIGLFSELRKLTLTVVIRALFGTGLAQHLEYLAGHQLSHSASTFSTVRILRTVELTPMMALNFSASLLFPMPWE
jgi:hypothetical protein